MFAIRKLRMIKHIANCTHRTNWCPKGTLLDINKLMRFINCSVYLTGWFSNFNAKHFPGNKFIYKLCPPRESVSFGSKSCANPLSKASVLPDAFDVQQFVTCFQVNHETKAMIKLPNWFFCRRIKCQNFWLRNGEFKRLEWPNMVSPYSPLNFRV